MAQVDRAWQAALRAWEAQATTSVPRYTPVVRNAQLALLPIQAAVMMIARAIHCAKTNRFAGWLATDVGAPQFDALAVPTITLAARITGGEESGLAWWADGPGFTPAIVGHGFIAPIGSKAGSRRRR
jgi:hypothetical protein